MVSAAESIQVAEPVRQFEQSDAPGIRLAFDQDTVGALRHQCRVLALQPGQPVTLERYIHLACKKIGEFTRGVPHRGQEKPVPERLAGFAVVANVYLDGFDIADGGADAGRDRRVCFRAL